MTLTLFAIALFIIVLMAAVGLALMAQFLRPVVKAEAHVFNSASDAREWRSQGSEGLGE